jgi:hypothetical protein
MSLTAMAMSMAGSASQASQTKKLNSIRSKEALENQRLIGEQDNYHQIARTSKLLQQSQQLYNESLEISRRAREAIGMSKIDVAESSAKGKSIEALYQDFERQKADQQAGIDYNLEQLRAGYEFEGKASGINSRLMSASPQQIGGPTLLSAISGALSTGISVGIAAHGAGIGGGSTATPAGPSNYVEVPPLAY